MSNISLTEFVDKVNEIMPLILREFIKRKDSGFHKIKITMPQFVILDFVNRNGESRMTELANMMNVTTAAMTGIVDRLVRDGYVIRLSDVNDRRIIKIKLTPKGGKVVKSMIQQRRRMAINLFSKISQAERENYLKILMRIRDRIK